MSEAALSVETDGHVATLWLDNPDRRNAMGPALWRDLPLRMQELGGDDSVRAVVVAAKGPHFSVGLDLKALPSVLSGEPEGEARAASVTKARPRSAASRAASSLREIKRLQASISSVAQCPKPVVAAVHGYCIGGGVDLISACDIRLCSADAVFSVRETRMAIVADLGSLQRLPRIVPAGHLAELAFTGKDIDAERARQIGLVNDVLADQAATLAAARSLAGEIASNSPLAVQGTKRILEASAGRSVEEGLDYVATWNAAFLASNDLDEALTSFLEKRRPRFSGD